MTNPNGKYYFSLVGKDTCPAFDEKIILKEREYVEICKTQFSLSTTSGRPSICIFYYV